MNILKLKKFTSSPLLLPQQQQMLKLGLYRNKLQIRYYARQSTRRTTTAEDTRTDQQTGLWQQQQQQQRRQDREPEYEGEDESTESALTSDVRMHLSKVYGLLMATTAMSMAGTLAAAAVPIISLPMFIASFLGVLGISFTDPSKTTLRQNMLLGVGFGIGAGIAPLVLSSSLGVVFAALLGTSSIFAGFSLAALKARRRSFLYMGGFLFGGMMLVFAASLAHLLLPLIGITNPAFMAALYNINVYGGLAIFSLFLAYDTQNMIESYKEGNDDKVSPALQLFLNVVNIFIRLLQIFGGGRE